MRPITNEDIKILGRLVNISTEGVVADASQVYDSTQHKNQEVINSEMKNKTKNATTTTYGIVRLASGINDNDNTDVPTIKILRDAIQDAVASILEDPNHTLQDQLNSIRELANAINNDASFYTTIQNWLAQKADKSAFDTLKSRVDNIADRVAELEACCEQVREYLDNFSITWNGARGGSHAIITPSTLRGGRNTVTIGVDEGYRIEEALTQNNIESYLEGNFDTVVISDFTDAGMVLTFTGVRSNIVINAHISRKYFSVQRSVTGPAQITFSNTSNRIQYGSDYVCTATIANNDDRYMINYMGTVSSPMITAYLVQIGDTMYTNITARQAGITITPSSTNMFEDEAAQQLSIRIPSTLITDDIVFIVPTWYTTSPLIEFEFDPSNQTEYDVYMGPATSDETVTQYSQDIYPVIRYQGSSTGMTYYVLSKTGTYYQIGDTSHPSLDDSTITITNGTRQLVEGTEFTWTRRNNGSRQLQFTTDAPLDATTYTATIHLVQPSVQTYSISYVGMTSRFHATNTATSVAENASFSTDFMREAGVMPSISMTVTSVTMGGVDITTQAKAGSHDVDIDHVTGNVVITVQENSDFFDFDGTITVSVSNGSASSASFAADGTTHTATITPNNGYTLTGATVSSDNNEVTASINGSTLTISGQSSNDATVTVTLQAEGTPTPSGPATISIEYIDDSTGQVYTDGVNTKSFTDSKNIGESFFMYIHEGSGRYWVPFGYTVSSVSVVMNGTDVTNDAYDGSTQTISISSVTGNTNITIHMNKLLSVASTDKAKFDAFGRVYSGYGQLNTDPYNYGTTTQSIKIAELSDFDGLVGATDSQKLEDLKSKTSIVIGGNAGRSVYDSYSNTMNITANNSAPFHAGQLYLSGQDVMVDVTCDPTDFTSGSVTTNTPTGDNITQSQSYSTEFANDINEFSNGGWANLLFVIDSTTQEGYYATLIRGIYQLVGASGSGVSGGIHWLYVDPANRHIVPLTAFEEIQVTCDNPSAVISTTYSGSNSDV